MCCNISKINRSWPRENRFRSKRRARERERQRDRDREREYVKFIVVLLLIS